MRPRRLEIEGFSAFRDRAEVDFDDAELFALVGPTGAGKSSVIDAMVFALYGSVPRYESENLVHPVITQGALEARVRLDFTVRGVHHCATRVVRRTRTGATTKEARLERFDTPESSTVLADDAKGLTAAVVELLGLDLEQFTKCVVLPQGAFAALLHDTKAKRQDLLVKLLDLGVYERVATAARAEVKRVGFRLESLDEQLQRAAHATDAAVAAASAHRNAVDAVVAELDAAAPALAEIDDQIRAADTELHELDASAARLARVEIPPGVSDIVVRARDAAAAVVAAEEEEAARTRAVADAEAARAQLPDPAQLAAWQHDHQRLAELTAKVDTGRDMVAELEAQAETIRRRAADAEVALRSAVAVLDAARLDNAAAAIAQHLHVGDECPVCGHQVTELVTTDGHELEAAEARWADASAAERDAAAALAAHDTQLAEYRARLDLRTGERDASAARLTAAPGRAEIDRLLGAIADADTAVADARRCDAAAREASQRARKDAEALARQVSGARTTFTDVRDGVAALGPPATTDDLADDWSALVAWAHATGDGLAERAAAIRTDRDALGKRRAEQLDVLADRARAAGVEVRSVDHLRDACLTAAATAQAALRQLAAERDHASHLRDERTALDERRQVHELLAEQLGARGFEAWLLDEALDALLVGASSWLEQLSSGRYAMTVDDKNQFAVIDHANADERRLARTLSGGETFLASLALALALAERVGELSATGGTRLDAIFLDEGFGTLDPATLDVVATAIEELGATGRMVGVISHVRELADRVPVRFEIAKAPGTSTVRRVET